MELPGSHINPINMFRSGIAIDGDFDVEWFCTIPSASAAEARLLFLRTPRNIHELIKRGYGGPALDRMWKSVYRGCLQFNVPIPTELHQHADQLGVVVTE